MAHKNEKDLENYVETYEEEEIQLLEDRSAGTLIYFFQYFFEKAWVDNVVFPLVGVVPAFSAWSSHFSFWDIYYQSDDTGFSHLISPLWLTIHYIVYFIMLFLWYMLKRRIAYMGENVIETLLEKVAETDLMGDPVAWRRIAFRVNQCFMSERYNNSTFYSGEQCRRFFVREIVRPIESGTYDLRTHYRWGVSMDYWKGASKKKLLERGVANYNKSIEHFDELSDMSGKDECDDSIFETFLSIIKISTFSLGIAEIAFSAIMALTLFVLTIYLIIS